MISFKSDKFIAGVDEAGRGCLAGPVVAAAVILSGTKITGLKDSKKLSSEKRSILADVIKKRCVCWSVGVVWPKEIDRYNIFHATTLAMIKAVKGLEVRPDFVFVDGRFSLPVDIKNTAIVKGDDLVPVVSAASIIAKTFRDKLMDGFDRRYPIYGFASNKGYPTREHLKALERYGPCPIHRFSFSPVARSINKGKRGCLIT